MSSTLRVRRNKPRGTPVLPLESVSDLQRATFFDAWIALGDVDQARKKAGISIEMLRRLKVEDAAFFEEYERVARDYVRVRIPDIETRVVDDALRGDGAKAKLALAAHRREYREGPSVAVAIQIHSPEDLKGKSLDELVALRAQLAGGKG